MSLDQETVNALAAYNACDLQLVSHPMFDNGIVHASYYRFKDIIELNHLPEYPTKPASLFDFYQISDALLKLKVPGAGFLADLVLQSPSSRPLISPAHTVLFAPKSSSTPSSLPPSSHFADLTPSSHPTITVISQPAGQRNAVLGGLVAARIRHLGSIAIVVDGRIRDITELESLKIGVWSKGRSTVGAGAEAKCVAVGSEIEVEGVKINEGDIVFADPVNGVVIIPREKVDAVLELLPRITGADEKVREDVLQGRGLQESFNEYRKGL